MFGYCCYYNYNTNWLFGLGMVLGALNNLFSSNKRAYAYNNTPIFSYPAYTPYPQVQQNYNLVGDALLGLSSTAAYSGYSSTPALSQIESTPPTANYNLVGDALTSLKTTASTPYPCTGSYPSYITMPPMIGVPTGAPYSTYLNNATAPTPTLLQIASRKTLHSTAAIETPNSTSTLKLRTNNNKTLNSAPSSTTSGSSKAGNNSRITRSSTKVRPSKDIINRVKQIAVKINCDYKDLLGLIYSESGFYTVTPGWNGKSAIGLIQFTDICIEDINKTYNRHYTKQSIAKMSALQQLDLAELALIRAKKIAGFPANHRLTAGELYAINYAPANARKDIVAKRGDGLYEGNEGLDLNKDGKISQNELGQRIKNKSLSVIC